MKEYIYEKPEMELLILSEENVVRTSTTEDIMTGGDNFSEDNPWK